jgi:hypothetical protein
MRIIISNSIAHAQCYYEWGLILVENNYYISQSHVISGPTAQECMMYCLRIKRIAENRRERNIFFLRPVQIKSCSTEFSDNILTYLSTDELFILNLLK